MLGAGAGLGLASGALAQVGGQPADQQAPVNSSQSLRLPQNPQVFGQAMPSVVKATAIVNGDVITQTDDDQRLAFMAIANGGEIPAGEVDRLREQVLRNLIDETLQIQAAKTASINVTDKDIEKMVTRVADNVKQTPEQLRTLQYLLVFTVFDPATVFGTPTTQTVTLALRDGYLTGLSL